jgi:hypothetical protein
MQGRYGSDSLERFLIFGGLALDILGMLLNNGILIIIADAFLLIAIFRMMSRNTVKRSIENDKYESISLIPRRHFKAMKMSAGNKTDRYYVCPSCHQIVRVPRGHGKVTITCPKCRKEFDRRS